MRAIAARLIRLDEDVIAILLIALVVVVVMQIWSRYVMGDPLLWTLEVAESLFVWLIFVGGVAGVRQRSLQGIDLLLTALPAVPRRALAILLYLMMIGFVGIMVWYGWALTQNSWLQRMPTTGVPRALVFIAVPLSGVWMLVHLLFQLSLIARGRTD